jgi:hypothetical protein
MKKLFILLAFFGSLAAAAQHTATVNTKTSFKIGQNGLMKVDLTLDHPLIEKEVTAIAQWLEDNVDYVVIEINETSVSVSVQNEIPTRDYFSKAFAQMGINSFKVTSKDGTVKTFNASQLFDYYDL